MSPAQFERWVEDTFARFAAELGWAEIARALAALSADYVHRRARVPEALEGRGKRAAFALYYAPRHFVLVRETLRALRATAATPPRAVVDLGCGTAAAGAAWAAAYAPPPWVLGADTQPWALAEAARTLAAFAVPGRLVRSDIDRLRWPRGAVASVAAWTVNELRSESRARLLRTLEARARAGGAVLVIEPLARGVTPWWPEWVDAAAALGGYAAELRFDVALPEPVTALGRSAGLDPGELGCRALWVPQRPAGASGGHERVGQ